MLANGADAPLFTLPNQDGDDVSLETYRGSHVVLYFYPRADTPGCTTEACGFRDAWDQFTDAGISVLAVSDDPVSDLRTFADKYDLPFELLSDPDGDVSKLYDSYGEKQMFGNTFDGVFRNSYVIGPDGTITHVYEGVSPEGHAEEILSDLSS
ncbi:thioredoxin-dependent thiol peroxidase [Natronocalculus amylovorans]|uniref:thioredoxin-dependent peroxiredoxin n=1 Tax=Natronocalculus amylovorans TaxID=2917812 RepID=A0AAE3K9R0_9EURY|nr:thioredoxin-dependent thiol peroxidase [Natronocalculus amylovorans]MCL9817855.1 thioredoxin-dependent thiol peroxidase [Natronocalculus amylovorans]